MSAIPAVTEELTPASVWQGVAGAAIDDDLLEWPPDLFALTDAILERSEAYRFALSPPGGVQWPPARLPEWPAAVVDAGRRWSAWADGSEGTLPDLLSQEWRVFREAAEAPLARLADARDWRACEALLTLHAIADEACAGLGGALDAAAGEGLVFRARARELLARTGSLARIPSHFLRVLPKVRTPPNGTSLRSLSRYATAHTPGVEAYWHKVPSRRPRHDGAINYLLLPWPLRVRESDFRPVGSAHEDSGFFEFAPSEGLDLDLVDRTLVAARDEVGGVNVVVLPESAVDETEIDDLQALLARHDVFGLIAGVRQRPEHPGRLPRNWVHLSLFTDEHWVHVRQGKHHRWSLDQSQIYQYHLGGALHPHVRWWEAMEVPRRQLHLIDFGARGVLVSLVCEDLAQIDDVADVIRSIGPTIVVTPLLDGPQLSSRWAARYASVLADDPGSAVLTLTSFGMAQRSRPTGQDASTVVALWKGPGQGAREIPLEAGAHGILLSASMDQATRQSFDGRRPVVSGSELFNMSVYQVRAASTGTGAASTRADMTAEPVLERNELTILTSWSEAVAEAAIAAPERIQAMLANARRGAPWRAALGIAEPSEHLDAAISQMRRAARNVMSHDDHPPLDRFLPPRDGRPGEPRLERLVRRVLRSAITQRQMQQLRVAVRSA